MSAAPMPLLRPLDRARPRGLRLDAAGAFLALCVAAAAMGPLAFMPDPFGGEAGVFAYVGRTVWQGGRLYRDAFDARPPGAGLLAAGIWAVFGGWWPGWVLLQLAVNLAAAWALATALRRAVGASAGFAAGVAAVVFLSFSPMLGGGFSVGAVQASLACFAAGFALRALSEPRRATWPAFAAGLIGGASATVGVSGLSLPFALAAAVALTRRQRETRQSNTLIAALAGGAAVPVALVAAWAWRAGIVPDLPAVASAAWHGGVGLPVDWILPAVALTLFAFPLVVRGAIFRGDRWRERGGLVLYETYRLRRDPTPRLREIDPARGVRRTLWTFALAWLAAALICILVVRPTDAQDLLSLAGPAALCYGLLPRRTAVGPMALGLGPVAALSLLFAAPHVLPAPDAADAYVAAHLRPGECLFAPNIPAIALRNGYGFGTRFGSLTCLADHDGAPRQYGNLLLADLADRRPDLIVLPADLAAYVDARERGLPSLALNPRRRAAYRYAWERLTTYVAAHYRLEATATGQAMWRLNETPRK